MQPHRPRQTDALGAAATGTPTCLTAAGVAIGAIFSGHAPAADAPPATPPPMLPGIEVTGTAIHLDHDVSQSVETVDAKVLTQQNLTLVQDALRNVPGVTLNAGEGGAHGDSINLRGLSIPDSFFLDGVRDTGQYQRDTFNSGSISVLFGPGSAVFGRGSTAGVINSVSKHPGLAPLAELSVSAGQADWWRGTGDFNLPINDTMAARLTLMDQSNGERERDQVRYRRWGIAPTLATGIDTATRVTLAYFHEVENNLPDYGIPFIDGVPAHVDRNNYYGLVDYDSTRTNTHIGTVRLEHDLSHDMTLSDSLRYANYGFQYLVTAPFLGNDVVPPPPPGTPYADIEVSRDQPSSAGTTSLALNRTDLTSRFEAGGFKHLLITGVEFSKEQSNVSRFQNGLDTIAPTPLLNPDPFHTPPTPLATYSNPRGRGEDVSVYALDSIALGPRWDLDLGLRWDHFDSRFSEGISGTGFSRVDTFVSPRLAVIFKPDAGRSYYLSYGNSYNPVIEYLIVAPSDQSLAPEKTGSLEWGAKIGILGGLAELTGALFDTRVSNARISDPDDPTVQTAPFDQRVRGVELGISGYLTEILEISANYTHLDDRITATSDPLSRGRFVPNTPHDALNLWTTLEPGSGWTLAGGLTAMSHRYADAENTAGVPAYAVFNAVASYKITDSCKLQINLDNVTNKLYFTSIYYTGIPENHALPGAGRTLIGTVTYRF